MQLSFTKIRLFIERQVSLEDDHVKHEINKAQEIRVTEDTETYVKMGNLEEHQEKNAHHGGTVQPKKCLSNLKMC